MTAAWRKQPRPSSCARRMLRRLARPVPASAADPLRAAAGHGTVRGLRARGDPERDDAASPGSRQPPICPNCGCDLKRFEPFSYGNVAIDERQNIVFGGIELALGPVQHEIVASLIRARGRPLTRDVLANRVDGEIDELSVRKYIQRARAVFLEIDRSFDQIVALRGLGAYRWRVEWSDRRLPAG